MIGLVNGWRYYYLSREEYLMCKDRVLVGNFQSLFFVNFWFSVLVFVSGAITPDFFLRRFAYRGCLYVLFLLDEKAASPKPKRAAI